MLKRSFVLYEALLLALLSLLIPTIATSTADFAPTSPTQTRSCSRPDETAISYRGDGTYLNKIYNDLTSCPNITSLDLDFTWEGCEGPGSEIGWAFAFREGDRFPKIRKLAISDYDLKGPEPIAGKTWRFFGRVQEIMSNIFPSSPSTEFQPQESNLEKWMRVMDFAELEDLNLGSGNEYFYERMKGELPNLQSLSVLSSSRGNVSIPDHQLDFLNSIPPLQSLAIHIGAPYYYANPPIENRTLFPLMDILARHGSTLHDLSLSQTESEIPHLHRPMLSIQNLTSIRTSCPFLTHLTLDIDRNGSWPDSTLDALTSIPSLNSLTVNLEIGADLHPRDPGSYGWNPEGLGGEGPFREPRMSLPVAEQLFQDLSAKKQGKELEKVEFVVGDYGAKPYLGPLYLPNWDEGRGRMFVCGGGGEKSSSRGKGTRTQAEGRCQELGGNDPYPDPWDVVAEPAGAMRDEL